MIRKKSIIENKSQMIDHLASGCKPLSEWRIGTEHEKIGFYTSTLKPLEYRGGIEPILNKLQRFNWEPIFEDGNIIALKRNGASISLEPGGQLELSGAPLENVHQTCSEVSRHLKEVKEVADEIDIGFISLGFRPDTRLEDVPIMPKGRYKIMREYMQKVGTLGREMMFRTCTVQTNLDFSSESDMVKKFRVSLALQPIATALFANSPFTNGKLNGYKSYRSRVWLDTDNDRTGMLPFVFDEGFGFEQYVDYALDVPMYFINRGGNYIDVSGSSFKDFIKGNLKELPSEKPSLSDFDDHLSTIFPEVRLKTFLEMRGSDTGPWSELCAMPAFWVGLLYNNSSLEAAWDLIKDWTSQERNQLRYEVPLTGLQTQFRGKPIIELVNECLNMSRFGLNARSRINGHGDNESIFLQKLYEFTKTGKTNADKLIHKYNNDWDKDVMNIYNECRY